MPGRGHPRENGRLNQPVPTSTCDYERQQQVHIGSAKPKKSKSLHDLFGSRLSNKGLGTHITRNDVNVQFSSLKYGLNAIQILPVDAFTERNVALLVHKMAFGT